MLREIQYYFYAEISPYLYLLLFLLILYLFMLNYTLIKKYFSAIPRKYWVFLLVIFLLGTSLRMHFSPMADILNADSWEYRIFAKSMMDDYGLISCDCPKVKDMHVHGYSFVQAIAYFLFGLKAEVLYSMNLFFGTISVLAMFLLVYVLTKNEALALLSTFILSILPWHVFYSGTGVPEISNSFFVIISVAIFFISLELKKPQFYFFSYVLLLFSILLKKENIMLVLAMAAYLILIEKIKPFSVLNHIKKYGLFGPVAVLALFPAFEFLNLAVGEVRNPVFTVQNFMINSERLFQLLSADVLFLPLMLSFFGIMLFSFNKAAGLKKRLFFMYAWLIFQIIPMLFHLNWVHRRYLLLLYIPVVLIIICTVPLLSIRYLKQAAPLLVIGIIIALSFSDLSGCATGGKCLFDREKTTADRDSLFLNTYLESVGNKTGAYAIMSKPTHKFMIDFLYNESHTDFASRFFGFPRAHQHKIFSNYDVYYFDEKNCSEKWAEYCKVVVELPKTLVMQKEGLDVYKIDAWR
ncbi:MAG: glycosyltransferase family 39 protein [Candidatus Aenigmarchaeota archaeon]|nr:glycosyltransferase family 39 protein [Candidatus Aenigmarchaeota archaeon]